MIGEKFIRVFNKHVDYRLTLKRNITIIQGDSGTGKTTLFEMIAEYARLGQKSGVHLQCDVPCVALADPYWQHQLQETENSILFVDEGCDFVRSHEFARLVNESSNFFVLFYREALHQLAYSINEIYEFKTSGKYHTLAPVYKQRKGCLYGAASSKRENYTCLVCEDSHSGYQFYKARFDTEPMRVESAETKSSIHSWIINHEKENAFIIADGAAFGDEANRVMMLQEEHPGRITVCLPESFEWLILSSGLIDGDDVGEVLKNPQDFIESAEYASWERFFAAYLTQLTANTPFAYSKASLNRLYAIPENATRILKAIKNRNIQ